MLLPGDKALAIAVPWVWFLNGAEAVHTRFQSLPEHVCAVPLRSCFVTLCCVRQVTTVHLSLSLPPRGTSLFPLLYPRPRPSQNRELHSQGWEVSPLRCSPLPQHPCPPYHLSGGDLLPGSSWLLPGVCNPWLGFLDRASPWQAESKVSATFLARAQASSGISPDSCRVL